MLDEQRNRLYVMTRFDDAIKVVNLATKAEIASIALPNPEPAAVIEGRKFLYSGEFSANGEASCASCHIFSDQDELAWDLGVPEEITTVNPIAINLGAAAGLGKILFGTPGDINGVGRVNAFHPMKEPMTVQTLRGLAKQGALHWRADRANGPRSSTTAPVAARNRRFAGTGYTNEGSVDTLFRFFNAAVFNRLLYSGFGLLNPYATRVFFELFTRLSFPIWHHSWACWCR